MKNWEEMNARERAEVTFKDIKARQDKREQERINGVKQADAFMFKQKLKAMKKKDKIRNKSYK